MKPKEISLAIGAGAAVLLAGVWLARRYTSINPLPGAPTRFAPCGFAWNAQVGAYTRVNSRGIVEYVP